MPNHNGHRQRCVSYFASTAQRNRMKRNASRVNSFSLSVLFQTHTDTHTHTLSSTLLFHCLSSLEFQLDRWSSAWYRVDVPDVSLCRLQIPLVASEQKKTTKTKWNLHVKCKNLNSKIDSMLAGVRTCVCIGWQHEWKQRNVLCLHKF